MSRYFPLFVDLEGKKITVVGGGAIATRRIRALLEFGARITVIAPKVTEELGQLAEKGRLVWRQAAFHPDDPGAFADAFLVLAATDQKEVNLAVWEKCRELHIPVNLADDREKCDFYFPGIATGGGIVAGITAEGRDHRLAREATEQVRELLAHREKER